MTAFEEFGVIPQLSEAVSSLYWTLPTPVQSEAIPAILGGVDALIAAETGSGKTGAFCLPIAQIVWERRKDALNPSSSSSSSSQSEIHEFILNREDRDVSLQIDSDNLNCDSRVPKDWNGARCRAGLHTSGKYYYEVQIKRDGLCRIGFSTLAGTLKIGTDFESFGYGGTAKKSYGKRFDDYGKTFTTNDVIGCFLDLDNLQIWWSRNGEHFKPGYKINEKFRNPSNCLYPAVLLQNSALDVNFGGKPFKYEPGNGFIAINQAKENCVRWFSKEKKGIIDLNSPLCVILEPTRELVQQTFINMKVFVSYLNDPKIRCISLAAGVNMTEIIKQLSIGCDIIIGTPARVVDLMQTGKLAVTALQFIVIDEVDQFLADTNGSARQIDILFKHLPLVTSDGTRRQVIACSATMHNFEVERFANRHMSFPQWIDLKGTDCVSNDIHHVVCHVDANEDKQWIRLKHQPNRLEDDHIHDSDKIRLGTSDKNTISLGTKILKGIYVLKAIRALNMDKAIIFCRTKQQCDQMETFLMNNGLSAVCLHGNRTAEERDASLDGFQTGKIGFLICTDVVARGLDVQGVPFVINMTLPDEKAMYVHRIGRVGRAERMGLSISLVSENEEKVWFHTCRSRGIGCHNSEEVQNGGCAIWMNEKRLLGDIEEHIGSTISTVDSDFNIPIDEFDGKVVYGEKRGAGVSIQGHGLSTASSVAQLSDLETRMQLEFLKNIRHVFAQS
ncbi:unnamed protein product [Caenorhabditis angaria]|uniref:ATP-dependent RNA helicase n=1 Tax=Caenorhabditis angaria TaxID=860376 RepID=A0A9P1IP70_9PELO|nr:unnamed protein product [Caenorhabditis angaria]